LGINQTTKNFAVDDRSLLIDPSVYPDAIFTFNSVTKGVLFPRMSTIQKNAIPAPNFGLQVYDITLNQMSYYNGGAWVNF
jgi:hypothetical protein